MTDKDSGSAPRRGARGMNDLADQPATPWAASRSLKAKTAVQRNVTALFDELAPEKALTRAEPLKNRIEEHRTPSGCVLQASNAALSLSWFADSDSAGELHVVAWRGTVSRRGVPVPRENAVAMQEMVLFPIEAPADDKLWRTAQGTRYDTASLARQCLALLEEQIGAP